MKFLPILVLGSLIFGLVAGCADKSTKEEKEIFSIKAFQAEAVKLDKNKDNTLNTNQEAVIFLSKEGGNGYMWHCVSQDEKTVKILEHKIFVPKQTQVSEQDFFVGGKLLSIWKLQGLAPGKTQVNCKYYREWEGEKSTIEDSQFSLTVQ